MNADKNSLLDRRLLAYARRSLLALGLTIGLGFAAGLLTVLQADWLSQGVAAVFLPGQPAAPRPNWVAVLLGLMAARALLAWGSEVAAQSIARRVQADLRRLVFRHLLKAGPVQARQERFGELSNVLVEGIETLEPYFSQYLPQLALAALVPLTILVFIWPVDWLTGLVLLLTAPLIPLFMFLIGNASRALAARQWLSLSRMSAYFLDVLRGLTTLKMLGRSRDQAQVVAQVSNRFRQATMQVLRFTFLSALVLELLSTLSTAVVAVEIGLRLLYGRLEFAQAFFILLLAPEFYLPVRLLGTRFHASLSGVNAARRIFALLDLPVVAPPTTDPLLPAAEANLPDLSQEPAAPPQLTFQGVSAAYGERPALADISFTINPGEKVALVGASGSGKSTLASLLLRFLAPQQGQILVDGQPLAQIPPAAWLSRVAWAPQQPTLLNTSVLENIRLGKPAASLDEVRWAAEQAGAEEFIQALPYGYATCLGEEGSRLSGGQAQRIALARAFLRQAPLVILDEPAAHLDAESERQLQETLDRLLVGKTALMIAHRLGTVASADRVIVLEAGRIVEMGRHQDLLQSGGAYLRLLQAALQEAEVVEPGSREVGGPALAVAAGQPPAAPPAEILPTVAGPLLSGSSLPAAGAAPALPSLAVFWRLLQFARPYAGLIALSALCGFFTVLSQVGLLGTSAYIISAAALQPSIAVLQVPIVGVRFFGLSRGIFRYLERYLSHQATFHLLARLRLWFYQALEPLAPARLPAFSSADLFNRLQADIESLENFYVRGLAPPLVALLSSAAVAAYLASFSPPLALALLALHGVAGLLLPLFMRYVTRPAGRQLIMQRLALRTAIIDGLQGLPELLVFGRADHQAQQVEQAARTLQHAQRRLGQWGAFQNAFSGFLANLGLWVTLVLALPILSRGQLAGVYLATLLLAAWSSFEAILPLPLAAQYLESNLQAARRLFEIAALPPAVAEPAIPAVSEPALPAPEQAALEVRNLSFRYPEPGSPDLPGAAAAPPLVLDGVSFHLRPGQKLALVGPSGAGKSTLVSLLLRFYEYSEGEITLAGRDLRSYSPAALRRWLGVMAQRTDLFTATIADNLRIAHPSATQAELEWAAEQAQLHTFIASLPAGYQTWLGDQGMQLSGGQRRRLALARLLLKKPALLILDEPTAHLDPFTESQVFQALETSLAGRAVLLITHRLVGMQKMDEILVLDRGRVVQRGRHADLLEGGLYRRMWEQQTQVGLSVD